MFYNDRVSHLAADKTLTDAHFIIVLINALKSLQVKLRSHRANGRVTDKKLFYPFVSVRIRSLSVSHPVTPFLVR